MELATILTDGSTRRLRLAREDAAITRVDDGVRRAYLDRIRRG